MIPRHPIARRYCCSACATTRRATSRARSRVASCGAACRTAMTAAAAWPAPRRCWHCGTKKCAASAGTGRDAPVAPCVADRGRRAGHAGRDRHARPSRPARRQWPRLIAHGSLRGRATAPDRRLASVTRGAPNWHAIRTTPTASASAAAPEAARRIISTHSTGWPRSRARVPKAGMGVVQRFVYAGWVPVALIAYPAASELFSGSPGRPAARAGLPCCSCGRHRAASPSPSPMLAARWCAGAPLVSRLDGAPS